MARVRFDLVPMHARTRFENRSPHVTWAAVLAQTEPKAVQARLLRYSWVDRRTGEPAGAA
jgi:hypothetical protein